MDCPVDKKDLKMTFFLSNSAYCMVAGGYNLLPSMHLHLNAQLEQSPNVG